MWTVMPSPVGDLRIVERDGSIVAIDISKALTAAGYAVEPDHVNLDGPLKELGMYTVKLQFHPDVKSEVKVWVVPTARPATPAKK